MSRHDKIKERVLSGTANSNIDFDDLCALLRSLGFKERINSSHHIYTKQGIAEIINVQPKNGKAKPYKVKQVRSVIERHGL